MVVHWSGFLRFNMHTESSRWGETHTHNKWTALKLLGNSNKFPAIRPIVYLWLKTQILLFVKFMFNSLQFDILIESAQFHFLGWPNSLSQNSLIDKFPIQNSVVKYFYAISPRCKQLLYEETEFLPGAQSGFIFLLECTISVRKTRGYSQETPIFINNAMDTKLIQFEREKWKFNMYTEWTNFLKSVAKDTSIEKDRLDT